MKITWFGHTCFTFSEDHLSTVLTDPYMRSAEGRKAFKARADIVTVSRNGNGNSILAELNGKPFVIDGAGEYELGGVFITGVQTNRKALGERNTLFVYHYNELTIAHMGILERLPTQKEIEQLGEINIALVPVGVTESWNPAKAAELVSMLEPDYVIPMAYGRNPENGKQSGLKKFLKAMGTDSAQQMDVFSLRSDASAEADETTLVVLNEQ
ncbi:MAG TPA: hypothetical protein ENN32_00275 [Chloroflexi bacterium]|nr:hypothetical protein [Chloroflexota bacterium]